MIAVELYEVLKSVFAPTVVEMMGKSFDETENEHQGIVST